MQGLAQTRQRLYSIGVKQKSKTQIDYTAYREIGGRHGILVRNAIGQRYGSLVSAGEPVKWYRFVSPTSAPVAGSRLGWTRGRSKE